MPAALASATAAHAAERDGEHGGVAPSPTAPRTSSRSSRSNIFLVGRRATQREVVGDRRLDLARVGVARGERRGRDGEVHRGRDQLELQLAALRRVDRLVLGPREDDRALRVRLRQMAPRARDSSTPPARPRPHRRRAGAVARARRAWPRRRSPSPAASAASAPAPSPACGASGSTTARHEQLVLLIREREADRHADERRHGCTAARRRRRHVVARDGAVAVARQASAVSSSCTGARARSSSPSSPIGPSGEATVLVEGSGRAARSRARPRTIAAAAGRGGAVLRASPSGEAAARVPSSSSSLGSGGGPASGLDLVRGRKPAPPQAASEAPRRGATWRATPRARRAATPWCCGRRPAPSPDSRSGAVVPQCSSSSRPRPSGPGSLKRMQALDCGSRASHERGEPQSPMRPVH